MTNGMDFSLTQNLAYDAAGRLVMAGEEEFAYDANGNRTMFRDNWSTDTYDIAPDSNQVRWTSGWVGKKQFDTNANGNITAISDDYRQRALEYDAFNRLVKHSSEGVDTHYEINALDQRVGKWSAAEGGRRYINEGHRLLAEVGADGKWSSYLWLGNELVGLVRNNQLHAVHSDHLGRPEVVTDAARTVAWHASNHPFGRYSVSPDTIGGLNIGFPGQYWDAESGIWHNGRRDYLSTEGRYLQTDPIGLAGGLNTYGYANGDPVSFVDPDGLEGVGYWNGPDLLSHWGASTGAVSKQVIGGAIDFAQAYFHQLSATNFVGRAHSGWAGQDKYFHCRANCEAARRGEAGAATAQHLSNHREAMDLLMGDSIAACAADQKANRLGRAGGMETPGTDCRVTCGSLRPGGSFPETW